MSIFKTSRIASIVASLFVSVMLVSGCGGADDETGFDDESVDTDEPAGEVGEAESAMTRGTSGGGGDDFCGWFCPVWAKDLSDCLMIPCKD